MANKSSLKFIVSPLIILMCAYMTLLGYGYDFLSYMVAIILHEMAHAFVSQRLGYELECIRLEPYGASLTGSFEGVKWSDEVKIAIIGPLSNLVIAVIFMAIWWFFPATYFFSEIFVVANIFVALYNCVPIFPLDGGRALLALLSAKIPRERAYKLMRFIGYAICAVCVVFIIVYYQNINFSYLTMTGFVLYSTIFGDKVSRYNRLYSLGYRSERLKKGLSVNNIMVNHNVTMLKMLRLLNSNYYTVFHVVDDRMNTVVVLRETELDSLLLENNINCKLSECILSNRRNLHSK